MLLYFFNKYANALFPEAIAGNNSELQEVRRQEEAIKQNTISNAVEGLGGGGGGSSSGGDSGKSLLHAVDRTLTSAGGRLLGERLAAPLVDVAAINARLDLVDWFRTHRQCCDDVRTQLHAI